MLEGCDAEVLGWCCSVVDVVAERGLGGGVLRSSGGQLGGPIIVHCAGLR